MKINDRVYFAELVAIYSAPPILQSVVLAGDVAGFDATDGSVFVRLPGGFVHPVPMARACQCEEDAVALMRAAGAATETQTNSNSKRKVG